MSHRQAKAPNEQALRKFATTWRKEMREANPLQTHAISQNQPQRYGRCPAPGRFENPLLTFCGPQLLYQATGKDGREPWLC